MTPRSLFVDRCVPVALLLLLGIAHTAAATPGPSPDDDGETLESAAPGAGGTQLTLDLLFLGVSVAVAHRVGARTHLGAGVGLGGNFLNAMLLGGEHFSQRPFPSYEGRDRSDGEWLFDVVDVHVSLRRELSKKWRCDVGAQGALLLHFDDSDDDPGGASFVGVYVAPYWGGSRFQLGSRVRMGVIAEPDLREFGINVELIRARFSFGG